MWELWVVLRAQTSNKLGAHTLNIGKVFTLNTKQEKENNNRDLKLSVSQKLVLPFSKSLIC